MNMPMCALNFASLNQTPPPFARFEERKEWFDVEGGELSGNHGHVCVSRMRMEAARLCSDLV